MTATSAHVALSDTQPKRSVRSGGRRIVWSALMTATALGLAACASSTHTATPAAAASAVGSSSAAASLGSCGQVPSVAPKDSSGVLASLPAAEQTAYNGFSTAVDASAWANFKPKHAAPYTVAIAWNPPFNAFQTDTMTGLMNALKSSGKVNVIANVSTTSLTDVPGQLQQFNQLVSRKPDLIILEPLTAGPFVNAVASAAAAGIPVVSAWNVLDSKDAVSVGVNNFLQAATLAAKVVTQMGGRGSILKVHGIPGISQDTDAQAGFDAVLAKCPNIKVAGQITGNYDPSATKAATLQFLTTHPGTINGVLQSGTMTTGVINAFTQLGRPVPAIADLGSSKGSIAYAHAHTSTYQEFGTAGADVAIGSTIGNVALRTLEGDGPKVSQIITQPQLITSANLNSIYQSGWTINTPGDAAAPEDSFMTEQTLSSFFATQS